MTMTLIDWLLLIICFWNFLGLGGAYGTLKSTAESSLEGFKAAKEILEALTTRILALEKEVLILKQMIRTNKDLH